MLRIMLLTISLLLIPGWAVAALEISEYHRQSIDKAMADLTESEQILRAKDPAQWTQRETQHYLHMAQNSVMQAIQVYVAARRELPVSAQVLRDEQILPLWPGNPLRDWQPLDWQEYAPEMEFIPGGLILQRVPEDLCDSPIMFDIPDPQLGASPQEVIIEPQSFILSINGATPQSTLLSKRIPELLWGVIPPGSITYTTHNAFIRKSDYDRRKESMQRKAAEQFP